MKDQIQLLTLEYQYKLWKNMLSYLEQELCIIHERALELTLKYSEIDEPLFIMQKENIQQTVQKIKLQEERISFYAMDFPISKSHEINVDHQVIVNSISALETVQLGLLKKVEGK